MCAFALYLSIAKLTKPLKNPSNYNRDDQIKKEVIMVVFNKTKRSGVKKPFRLEEIWRIRTRLEIENNLMQLALLNLAIDSKLRASDLLVLRVCDVSSQDRIFKRVKHIQRKTDIEVQFEITTRTQQSLMKWILMASLHAAILFSQAKGESNNRLAIRTIDT
ncbi:hypothetical protein A140_18760 [Vibrio crassostreae 9ZC88]|nr:hypothetical protein A140_18760 [Vibrio crassostreae 9ZC88]